MAQGIARSAGLFTLPKAESLASSKLYFFLTGTSTPANVYQDIALTVPHSNPVVADTSGRFAPIYIDGALGDLRVSHYTSADVLIYTIDNYPASLGTTSSIDINAQNNPLIQLVQNGAASNNKIWYIQVASQQFKLSCVNDAFSSQRDFMTVSRSANTATQVDFTTQLLSANGDPVGTGDCATKTASDARNTITTLTADADMTVSLIANSHFAIECCLFFYATTTAAMGIKFDLTGITRAASVVQCINGAASVAVMNAFPSTPFTAATISTNSGAVDSVRFTAYASTLTASTVALRWAQNSSSANNLNLLQGSFIRAHRLA